MEENTTEQQFAEARANLTPEQKQQQDERMQGYLKERNKSVVRRLGEAISKEVTKVFSVLKNKFTQIKNFLKTHNDPAEMQNMNVRPPSFDIRDSEFKKYNVPVNSVGSDVSKKDRQSESIIGPNISALIGNVSSLAQTQTR